MDFRRTSEQEAFASEASRWLQANAPDHEVDPSRQGHLDTPEEVSRFKAWNHTKAGGGWAGVHWPVKYGGRGLTRLHTILYEIEESKYVVPRGQYLRVGPAFAAPTLMAYASEDVCARLLPKILNEDEFWCQLFSESSAGSDLAGISTRADRRGDSWVINGQKVWTTYAQWADWAILVARHDRDLPKHKGLVYFFVDMRSPGIEVRPVRQISGAAHFNEVFLTNVQIPDAQRLGEIGEGWQVALTTLMNERLGSGFSNAAPSFDDLLSLARVAHLGDEPAISDSCVRESLAECYVKTRGLALVRQRAITQLARGQQPGPETSISKVVSASHQQDVASLGLDLANSAALDPATATFWQAFLDSPGNRIAGGTDEVLRNVIAERVLGLPGDVRVDRDKTFRELVDGTSL